MNYITVKSIGGSIWSFKKDRIVMVSKRFTFPEEDMNQWPELKKMKSCAIIRLDCDNANYLCKDSYKSIMAQLEEENR